MLQWRQPVRAVLPQWNQRRSRVAKLVAETDDLWHAAEVLPQDYVARTEAQLCMVEETSVDVERSFVLEIIKKLINQMSDGT